MSPEAALTTIAWVMSATESWSADTLDAIADIVRSEGHTIADIDEGRFQDP